MTYPIHDWRDRSKYPQDPLDGAPVAFVEERRECGQSDAEIRLAVWRWQFLRRHKLYQDHWRDEGDEYIGIFGICGFPRPDPKIDFPTDLLFNYELVKKKLRYPTILKLEMSWEENAINLKQQYNFLRATTSAFELALASLYASEGKLTGERKRQLGEAKYPTLLRVLDALALGETLTQIAKELGSSPHYNTAARWRKNALDLQATLTQLPHLKKSDF